MATPSAPIVFKRPLVMRNQIELHWNAPLTGGPILEYRVQCASPVLTYSLTPTTFFIMVGGLNEGQEYAFTVQARNSVGWGAVGEWPAVTTGVRPGNVSDLSGNVNGITNAEIRWSLATQNGNSPIKHQVIQAYAYDLNGNRTPADDKSKSYKTNVTNAFITNFTLDRDYKIYVKAVNDVGYSFSRQEGPYLQLRFQNNYNVVAGVKSTVGSAGMTQFISSSDDDANEQRSIPFDFTFYNNTYNSIYFVSNTYLTFGGGTSQYSGLSINPPNPSLPTLFLGAGDHSWQQVWDITGTNLYRLRYEGTDSTGGTVGSPTIVYEITFYKQQQPTDDIYVEIVFGTHDAAGNIFGVTDGSSTGVDFQSDEGVPLTANNSYVLVLNPDGTFKQILSGYHIETNLL